MNDLKPLLPVSESYLRDSIVLEPYRSRLHRHPVIWSAGPWLILSNSSTAPR